MAVKGKMKQGDAGLMGVELLIGDDAETMETVTEEDLPLMHCIEFMIGEEIRGKWPDNVLFADGLFLVPFTQEESFQLQEGDTIEVDVRVHFATNTDTVQVKGIEVFPKVKIVKAISDKELS